MACDMDFTNTILECKLPGTRILVLSDSIKPNTLRKSYCDKAKLGLGLDLGSRLGFKLGLGLGLVLGS